MVHHHEFLGSSEFLADNHRTKRIRCHSPRISNDLHHQKRLGWGKGTCASPSCRPRAGVGSKRQSIQVITTTLRTGIIPTFPLVNVLTYCALACSNSFATDIFVCVRRSMRW